MVVAAHDVVFYYDNNSSSDVINQLVTEEEITGAQPEAFMTLLRVDLCSELSDATS